MKLEISELDFRKSLHESITKNECLLGLGGNFYDPTTKTLAVFAYSKDIESVLSDPKLWFANRTLCHEIGHYILSTYTRFGRLIRDMNAIQNGLTFLIINRMLNEHKTLWIPFNKYLDFNKKHDKTVKLISDLHQINRLGTELVKEWKTAQELFAYSWSGLFNLTTRNALSALFSLDSEDKFNSIFLSANTVSDFSEERIHQIISKIDPYLRAKYSITWDQISLEKLDPIVKDLKENAVDIFGSEDRDVIEFLDAVVTFKVLPSADSKPRSTFEYKKEIIDNFRKHVDPQFEQGAEEHRRALEVFKDCLGNNPLESMNNVLVLIAISSCLFAPRILPEEVLKINESNRYPRFNDFVKELPKFTKGEVGELFDSEFLNSVVPTIQSLTGSVTLQELHACKGFEILGTDEWNLRLIAKMRLQRKEKKFLRQILELNKYLDIDKNSVIPLKIHWPSRLLLRFAFRIRGLLSRISFFGKIRGLLQEFNIGSYKDSLRFISTYKDLLSLLYVFIQKFGETELVDIPLMVTLDGESFKMYLEKKLLSNRSRMSLLQHLEGSFRDICIHMSKGFQGKMVFCPYALFEDSRAKFCEERPECWFYKFLRSFPSETLTLICPRNRCALFSVPVSTKERDSFTMKLNLQENCNFTREEINQPSRKEKSLSEYYYDCFGRGEESLLRLKERSYNGSLLSLIVCRGALRIYRGVSYLLFSPLVLIKAMITVAFIPADIFRMIYNTINKYEKWTITRALRNTSNFGSSPT